VTAEVQIDGVFVPAQRGRALGRAAFFLAGVAVCGILLRQGVPLLRFTPSGASNRIEDYALGFVLLIVAGLGVGLLIPGLRHLALALWPGPVGIAANPEGLLLLLGPVGRWSIPKSELHVTYPFEFDEGDEDAASFEFHLPAEVQESTLIPRIRHTPTDRDLREVILKHVSHDEAALAKRLGSAIQAWRVR